MCPIKHDSSSRPIPRGVGPRSRGCITSIILTMDPDLRKCDEQKPACRRCTSTNRKCAGYPSEADLIFRNEIPRLERKHGRVSPSKTSTEQNHDEDPEASSLNSNGPRPVGPVISYPVSLEQQALTFFSSRFIITAQETKTTGVGYLESLPMLLCNADSEGAMYKAAYANALSSLARFRKDSGLFQISRKQYGEALSLTNRALSDRKQAVLDETLMAVYLLSTFETTMSSTGNLSGWEKHTLGAATLIAMRGPSIFDTDAGTGLFYLNQAQMAIYALAVRKDLFKVLPTCKNRMSVLGQSPVNLVYGIPLVLEGLDRLASSEHRHSESLNETAGPLLARAAEINSEIDAWMNTLPPNWMPVSTVSIQPCPGPSGQMPPPFFPGSDGVAKAQQYFSIWTITIINYVRAGRINLLLTWLRTLRDLDRVLPSSPGCTAEMMHLRGIVVEEVDSICMTVASVLGCQITDPSKFTEEAARYHAQGLGGFFLIWPLWNAKEVPFLSEERRQWLGSWMKFIADSRGLDALEF